MVTGWEGPIYDIEVVAPDLGWRLRVESYRAVDYTGELVVDDPDGIVVDACFVDRRRVRRSPRAAPRGGWASRCRSGWPSPGRAALLRLRRRRRRPRPRCRSPAASAEPAWPGRGRTLGHRRCRRARHPARRHGRLLRVGRAASTTPSCAAARWWWAAPATGAWWRPPPTRPGPSASTRPCRRCGPGGCAPRPCSCTVATTATAR